MVLSALDVYHPVLRGVVNVVSLDACVPREVEDFLSGDHHGVRVVEACQVNVLVGVVVVVHLLKDLPGDIDFDPLPHGLEQIPVLAAGVLCATRHAMLSVQLGPCRFHHGVEDGVILLTNTLLHNKVLLGELLLTHPSLVVVLLACRVVLSVCEATARDAAARVGPRAVQRNVVVPGITIRLLHPSGVEILDDNLLRPHKWALDDINFFDASRLFLLPIRHIRLLQW